MLQGGGKGPEMLENYNPINIPCSPGRSPPTPFSPPFSHRSLQHSTHLDPSPALQAPPSATYCNKPDE